MSEIETNKLDQLVKKYLSIVKEIGLENYAEKEKYKFNFVSKFQAEFDLDNADLTVMFHNALDNNNLVEGRFYQPKKLLIILAKDYGEELRIALRSLFDEKHDIQIRIDAFDKEMQRVVDLYNENVDIKERNDFDIKFISLLLASMYPEKHYYIKTQEWNRFVSDLGAKDLFKNKSTTGGKYAIYSKLAEHLNNHLKDKNQIKQVHAILTKDIDFKDQNYNWMTQDVIFRSYRKSSPEVNPEKNTNKLYDDYMPLLENKKQLILYGPPGTGKTFMTKKLAVKLIEDIWGDNE